MIIKALFVETGTYNDMALRPYQATIDRSIVQHFQEVTNFGQEVNPENLSGVAGHFLRPTAQVGQDSLVQISNGWDTPRLRFMLEVEHQSALGMSGLKQIVTGYTDYVGVSPQTQSVNPDMRLYFNNVITLRQVQEQTPHGFVNRTHMANASHLLTGQYMPTAFGQPNQQLITMRPQDVFGKMGVAYLGDDTLDTRPTFGEGPVKKSRRVHGSAPQYVSKVIEAYRNTLNTDDSMGADLSTIMHKAKGVVQDDPMSSDPFFVQAMRQTSFSEGGNMSWGELAAMEPSLESVAQVFLAKNVVSSSHMTGANHQRGSTEYWNNGNMETVMATVLTHSVPSIMMDLMITGVAFTATNQTLTGEYDVRILGARSFSEQLDLSPYLAAFRDRLIVEILRGLSSNNQIDFNITMEVDVLGETSVSISMAGGPRYDYVTPSFCDALMAPVIANNDSALTSLGQNIEQLVDNISVYYGSPTSPVQGGGNDYSHII